MLQHLQGRQGAVFGGSGGGGGVGVVIGAVVRDMEVHLLRSWR